jgi:hypothetical protein
MHDYLNDKILKNLFGSQFLRTIHLAFDDVNKQLSVYEDREVDKLRMNKLQKN